MELSRRSFLGLLAAGVSGCACQVCAQQAPARILFGVCTGLDNAATLKEIGYDFIEASVSGLLKPEIPDDAFAPELEKIRSCTLPIRSLTGFIPARFRLTGAGAGHDAALDYAAKACERADAAGIPFIVLGSGGARRLPQGFDLQKGREQFIEFCQKLGERIKDCKVTIVLEPLNKGETNIMNLVSEGVEYVDAINRPRIQLLVDFFHMLKEGEGSDSIRKAGPRLRHCHIAELEGRKPPGTKGENFSAMFKALRDIGYSGGVSCECGWPKTSAEESWKRALETMRSQIGA